jgi:O-antigen/teichoic acid export membrane protein
MALSYAANILISRSIGLHGYGQYVVALGWALVLVLPARIGFDNSSLRFVTVYLERNESGRLRGFIAAAALAVTAASVLMAGVMLAIGITTLNDSARETSAWAALLIPPIALLGVFSPMMRAAQKIFASQFYDQMLRPLFIIAGLALFAGMGRKPNAGGAMMLTTIAAAGALVFLLLQFRQVYGPAIRAQADFGSWRPWFALSIPLFVIGAMQELMNQMEIILLGGLADARQAGLFAASWRLASLTPFALIALTSVSGPMIASAWHRAATAELHQISKLVARLGLGFAAAMALVLVVGGRWLLGLFGPEFSVAYPVLLVLLAGGIVNAFTGIVGYLLTLTGRERPALVIFGGALVVSVGLNLLLIPLWGAVGAAIASTSALSAWNLAMLFYVRRTMGIDASALALAPVRVEAGP